MHRNDGSTVITSICMILYVYQTSKSKTLLKSGSDVDCHARCYATHGGFVGGDMGWHSKHTCVPPFINNPIAFPRFKRFQHTHTQTHKFHDLLNKHCLSWAAYGLSAPGLCNSEWPPGCTPLGWHRWSRSLVWSAGGCWPIRFPESGTGTHRTHRNPVGKWFANGVWCYND